LVLNIFQITVSFSHYQHLISFKLYGLSINPVRLQNIRDERRSNSGYASIEQCQKEVRRAEDMYVQNDVPFIDTSHISIEEIERQVLKKQVTELVREQFQARMGEALISEANIMSPRQSSGREPTSSRPTVPSTQSSRSITKSTFFTSFIFYSS